MKLKINAVLFLIPLLFAGAIPTAQALEIKCENKSEQQAYLYIYESHLFWYTGINLYVDAGQTKSEYTSGSGLCIAKIEYEFYTPVYRRATQSWDYSENGGKGKKITGALDWRPFWDCSNHTAVVSKMPLADWKCDESWVYGKKSCKNYSYEPWDGYQRYEISF
jgi:hypothetical protein